MKAVLRIFFFSSVCACLLLIAPRARASKAKADAAIQAIKQASDPSAAVTAFANGSSLDRDNPKLYEGYVSRMVEMGLPEIAFHQAETLSNLEPSNGLALGVLAYVNARRGQMTDAISAIMMAGRFAPNHAFIQRTPGEILAWFDLKADKSKIPDNIKDGLANLTSRLEKAPAFASAYETAKHVYQNATVGQTLPQEYPETGAAASGYAQLPSYPPTYYPLGFDYYYSWGPNWVEPAPWWWWQPAGYFVGPEFVPFGTVVVFDGDDFFRHHHDFDRAHHNLDRIRIRPPEREREVFHLNNPVVWHHDFRGRPMSIPKPQRGTLRVRFQIQFA